MTTNGNWTKKADGARAEAPGDAAVFVCGTALCRAHARRTRRALRWKQDAVCRETGAAADADSELAEADGSVPAAGSGSESSSLTRTIFFTSRIQTQPLTRKENPNTNQKKKGKQKQDTVTIRKKLETLA